MVNRLSPDLAAVSGLMALEAAVSQILRHGNLPPDIEAHIRESFEISATSFATGRSLQPSQRQAFLRRGHQEIDRLFRG